MGQHPGCDLDQVGLQVTGIPAGEGLGELGGLEPERVPHQVIGFRDQLQVGVLDAVVDHLDVMPGATGPDVGTAGLALDLSADPGQDGLDQVVGVRGTAGHDAGPAKRPLLAARYPGPEVADPPGLDHAGPPYGVGEVGVAAVDQDVARVQSRQQVTDRLVDGLAGLDHQKDGARPGDLAHELLRRVGGLDRALSTVLRDHLVGAGPSPVVDRDPEAPGPQVARQVLAHGGQPHHRDLARRRGAGRLRHGGPGAS